MHFVMNIADLFNQDDDAVLSRLYFIQKGNSQVILD